MRNESRAYIKSLYDKGHTIKAISMHLGRSPCFVRKRLIDQGVKFRHRWDYTRRIDLHRLADLYYGEELSCIEIGKIMNFDPTSIWNALTRIGLPRRPAGGSSRKHYRGRVKRQIEEKLAREAQGVD